jgi:zinc protease
MRTTLSLILLLMGQPLFANTPVIHHSTLKNGLDILIKEDHRAPVASFMVWYHVGSADEVSGKTGLAHALEHMMFKGTPKYPQGVFSKTVAELGGQENAFTNTDYTAYFENIASDKLKTCFELEADRMNNLNLTSEEFSKEIKVIQEERRMRTDDNPQALAFERFLAAAHLTMPYHHPVIGWMSDLEHMTVTDTQNWYNNYYAPNNATLVIVGDVDPKKMIALAESTFGTITKQTTLHQANQIEPRGLGPQTSHYL